MRIMSRSSTITDHDDWLHNAHAGDMLLSEFLNPLDMTPEELADAIAMPAAHIHAVINGTAPMDAELDLRLARYFGMSEGFFLGLQIDYDLEEERRAHGEELAKIARRAA